MPLLLIIKAVVTLAASSAASAKGTINKQLQLYLLCLGVLFTSFSHAETSEVISTEQLGKKTDLMMPAEQPKAINDGLSLAAPIQSLQALVTSKGLQIESTSDGKKQRFAVTPISLSKGVDVSPSEGRVQQEKNSITLQRDILTERISSSADGIRQDFFIHHKPEGSANLTLDLALQGVSAVQQDAGVLLTSEDGRQLVYNRLHITDAAGAILQGRLVAVNSNQLQIQVDDQQAQYPILIDPTYSDAEWDVMNPTIPGTNGVIQAVAVINNELYVAGNFSLAGNVFVNNIAKWDGNTWSALGSGVDDSVRTLAVYNGELYAGGYFNTAGGNVANYIAKWDGNSWSSFGSGMDNPVFTLNVIGNELYVGGGFTSVDGVAMSRIAKWDGVTWSAMGNGTGNNNVNDIEYYNGELYAAVYDLGVFKWDGEFWNSLPSHLGGDVFDLEVYNGELYAGGYFTVSGDSAPSDHIAKWDGSSWSAVGAGLTAQVNTLEVYNGELYAGGEFSAYNGYFTNNVAKWNGSAWSEVAGGVNSSVKRFANYDGKLVVAGDVKLAGNTGASNIAGWDGAAWSTFGTGFNGAISSVLSHNGDLYVGGQFTAAPGNTQSVNSVVKWDGANWSSLGAGLTTSSASIANVQALTVYNGEIIAGGSFQNSGVNPVNIIARWDGANWLPLGTGLIGSTVRSLHVHNSELYAVGVFTSAGGTTVSNIAKWDGNNWSALGSGITGSVSTITTYKGDLIVAGQFTSAGGVSALRIAKWNGSAWSALGGGLNQFVNKIIEYKGELVAVGNFSMAGGVTVNRVAKWNGSNWSGLGTGLSGSGSNAFVYNDELIVSGGFSAVSGVPASFIAKWNGSDWSALGSGFTDGVASVMTIHNDKLYLGGTFTSAGGKTTPYFASLITPVNISFDGNGATAGDVPPKQYKNPGDASITVAGNTGSLTRTGYSFVGWNTSADGSGSDYSEGSEYTGDTNTTLYAKWTLNDYTLTFDSAGGSPVTSITANFGASVTAPANPSRTGYTFAGWSPAFPATMPSEDTTYTAQWTANSYTLTFDSAGGSVVAPITAAFGSSVTAPAAPTREGHTFTGWSPAIPSTMPSSDTTVTAQWTVNSYTLTFDSAGGSAVNAITADFGAAVTAPTAPTRDGYTFAGWSPAVPSTMPSSDTTVTAQWTVNSYTLTFDSAGGSAVGSITAAFGSPVTAPTAPTREGYTFTAWSPAIPSTMPSADTTLTAQWTVNSYSLSFDSAGGSAVNTITADFGAVVTAPTAPTREGYTFAGWSPALPATIPSSDVTLIAQWTLKNYTLTFDSAGGSAVTPITAAFGSSVTAPTAPTREGYTFAGWSPAVPGTMPGADATFTAQWTINNYTLSFDAAGGSAVASINQDYGTAISAPAAPTREGYTFAGWNPVIPATMPSSNVTLIAQWTLNNYTLTFDSAGGSAVSPIVANFGSSLTAPASPVRTGYSFTGWSPAVPATMPAADTTVTAQWTINSYTLSFNTVGGSAVASITADFGSSVVAPASPTREGYAFTGWSPALPATMPSTDTTLTAQWSANNYTLSFDTAGGSAVAPITAAFGSSVTPPASPTREGYTFTGWSPALPATIPAADASFTAQWTLNSYTLTFDTSGGSVVASITADFGSALTAPAAPTREGYTFAGWNPAFPETMPSENRALTALWTGNSYTLTFDSAGGSAVAPITANAGTTVTAPPAPTRAGYAFAGWAPALPSTMPTADTSYTAQWVENGYTLTFDSAGGSAVAPITASVGSQVTAPQAPTREGHTFTGWVPAVPATMPAENRVITAQWSVNSYTLEFDTAGGSVVGPITTSFGSNITPPSAPEKDGYTFAGWSPLIPTTMPATNLIVTAQWTVNNYTLTFDSAGGSAVEAINAGFGSQITEPPAPTREGHTFTGWAPAVPATMPAENRVITAQWSVNSYTLEFDTAGGSVVEPITASFGADITQPNAPTRDGYLFTGWVPAVPTKMPAQNTTHIAQYDVSGLTVTATVTGQARVSPASQQVAHGSSAIIDLTLDNPGDVVILSGTCEAALSGNKIVTAAITQNCDVAVAVYPTTTVVKDTNSPLPSNGASRLAFIGGAGSKTLEGGYVTRSGEERALSLEEAMTLLTTQADGSYIFSSERTGRYTLNFADNVSTERVSVVYDVLPYVAFTSAQQAVQLNAPTTVRLWLSDAPIEYPVIATLAKEGVSEELQQIEFTSEQGQLLAIQATAVSASAKLAIQKTGIQGAFLGSSAEHVFAVQSQAPALALSASALQNNIDTYVIDKTSGPVTVFVKEQNGVGAAYSWSASGLPLQVTGSTATFDPTSVAEGRFTIVITAKAEDGRIGRYDLSLRVMASCPVGDCEGAGRTGIPDSQNIFAQTPNRLPLCPAVVQENTTGACKSVRSEELYIEVPGLYKPTLGALTEDQSWSSGKFGAALNTAPLNDPNYDQIGLIVNFDVLGLQSAGEVVPVAIPLPIGTTIPANAVWRKFINGRWQDFVVNEANKIESAARELTGSCPGVSSDKWSSGLTQGHDCIRLSIEDGGQNDDDGVANSVIRDPGVLAVPKAVVTPPIVTPPVVTPPKEDKQSGGSLGWLWLLLLSGVISLRRIREV